MSAPVEKWTVEYRAKDGSIRKARRKGADPDRIIREFRLGEVVAISEGWQ